METQPEFCPLGIDRVLVRFGRVLTDAANARALAFRDLVAAQNWPGVTEVATSLTSVGVQFDPTVTTRNTITTLLAELVDTAGTPTPTPRRRWTIPVSFAERDAPQLAEAAALAGTSPQAAVDDICGTELRVIAIGFAPGQPYLGMLPDQWDIPRQNQLTEALPHGALIVAVRQVIIWAADAPTGWRHVGQSAFQVYRPTTDDPFAFAPGDLVRFAAVAAETIENLRSQGDPDGGAQLQVLG